MYLTRLDECMYVCIYTTDVNLVGSTKTEEEESSVSNTHKRRGHKHQQHSDDDALLLNSKLAEKIALCDAVSKTRLTVSVN